jgi:hypothetical protein
MGLNRSKKPAMYRLFRFVVNIVLRSGRIATPPCGARKLMIDAAWRDKFRMPPRSTRYSKQQFRSGKPVT